jgi:hypothetical protein
VLLDDEGGGAADDRGFAEFAFGGDLPVGGVAGGAGLGIDGAAVGPDQLLR